MAAAKLLICLTSQAEGCSLELWNTHKGFLKQNFRRVVQEVKTQQRRGQENGDQSDHQQPAVEEPLPVVTGGSHSSNEDRGGSNQRATSASSAPSTATSQRPGAVLKYTTI